MICMEKVHSVKLYGELDFSDYVRPRSSKFKSNWHMLSRCWAGDILRKCALFADLLIHERMRAWLGSFNSSLYFYLYWLAYIQFKKHMTIVAWCAQQKSSIPAMYFNWLIFFPYRLATVKPQLCRIIENLMQFIVEFRWLSHNPTENIVISHSSTRMASPLKRGDSESEPYRTLTLKTHI